MQYQINVVVEMDPRHPLVAAAYFAADTELEGSRHFRQCTAAELENDTAAHGDHANRMGCCLVGGGLPGLAHAGQKVVAFPTKTSFGSKMVDCIRFKIPSVEMQEVPLATPKPTAAPLSEILSDEIPF